MAVPRKKARTPAVAAVDGAAPHDGSTATHRKASNEDGPHVASGNRRSARLSGKAPQNDGLEVSAPARRGTSQRRVTLRQSVKAEEPVIECMPTRKSDLEELPMDVLGEIFALVLPAGMLALARTSKTLRAFLMSRKSEKYWLAARSAIKDIPPCPRSLSEPQYANLVFTTQCTNCAKTGVKNSDAIWDFFVRYCQDCKEKMLVHQSTVFPWRDQVAKVTKLERANFVKKTNYVPRWTMSREKWPSSGGFYHLPEFIRFKEAWEALSTAEDKTQLIKTLIAEVEEKGRLGDMIASWAPAYAMELGHDDARLKRERMDAIMRYLANEGWGEEVDKLSVDRERELRKLFARTTQRLYDFEWTVIRPKVIAKMAELRAARLAEERSNAIRGRLYSLRGAVRSYDESRGLRSAPSDVRAEVADLALVSALRQVIDTPADDADVMSEKAESEMLAERLPHARDQWYRDREKEFQELAQKTAPAQCKDPSQALSLAIVAFRCNFCSTDLRWPDVLAHGCARRRSAEDTYWAAVISFCHTYSMPYPYKGSSVFNVQFVPQVVQDMIRIAGFDPYNVSYKDMQSCGTRWYCKICTVPSVNYAEVHTWQSVTEHVQMRCGTAPKSRSKLSSGNQSSKWQVLDKQHAASARAVEAAQRTAGHGPEGVFVCARCQFISTYHPVSHCKSVHRIKHRPEFGDDFYFRPAKATEHFPIKIYPERARSNAVASKAVAQRRALFSSRFELLSSTGST